MLEMHEPDVKILQVKDLLEVLNKQDPEQCVTVWINSQSPIEPSYSGGSRIPVVHVDDMIEGTLDICCESYHQEHAGRHALNAIVEKKMSLTDAQFWFTHLLKGCADRKIFNDFLYEVAFYKFVLNCLRKMKDDFDFVKRFGVAQSGPSSEQIKEYIELCLLENVTEF